MKPDFEKIINEYIDIGYESRHYQHILKAMKEAWNKAVEMCAESAEAKIQYGRNEIEYAVVNKESILKNKIG